ncbi:hypothetical protein HQ590_14130 [bacterium]|nr:hypothetical protein [bacterium]
MTNMSRFTIEAVYRTGDSDLTEQYMLLASSRSQALARARQAVMASEMMAAGSDCTTATLRVLRQDPLADKTDQGANGQSRRRGATVDPCAGLVEVAGAAGLRAGDLDSVLHDVAARMASAANNDGLAGQVRWLVDQCGAEEARRVIKDAKE